MLDARCHTASAERGNETVTTAGLARTKHLLTAGEPPQCPGHRSTPRSGSACTPARGRGPSLPVADSTNANAASALVYMHIFWETAGGRG
ncbi:hypothetical protein C8Q78DRAFT_1057292 [Trametes maxima]|nr:hypothetical protein C8Q78DRAFT_1057292 [Trametes maxima]